MAIKLPVRVEARVEVVEDVQVFAVVDADEDVLFFCESREEADEAATALNERPALIAERDRLRESVKEHAAAVRELSKQASRAAALEKACKAALLTHGLAESEAGLPSLAEVEAMLRLALGEGK